MLQSRHREIAFFSINYRTGKKLSCDFLEWILALFFQTGQGGDMDFVIDHVVDLEQVDVIGLEHLEGIGDLLFPCFLTFGPHLGRQVELVPLALGGDADYFLRLAVPGGGVDEVDVVGQAVIDDLLADGDVRIRFNIEGPESSQADDRNIKVSQFASFQLPITSGFKLMLL